MAYEDGFNGTNLSLNNELPVGTNVGGNKIKTLLGSLKENPQAWKRLGLSLGGGFLSSVGATWSGAGHTTAGSLTSLAGGALSGASYGMSIAPGPWGAAIGGIVGALTQLPAVIKAISGSLEQEVENLKKKTEELNIQRVEDKQTAEDLSSYIEKYNKLRAAQYDSAEAA
nr:MAG TPA: protein of unknown function (DUF3482) [Caudoviricetes sp.]